MSSTINEVWNSLYANNPKIKALAVVESSNVVWQTSNWNIVDEGPTLIEEAKNRNNSITQGGVRYSCIDASDNFYIGSSGENGHLLIASARPNLWLIAWASSDSDAELAMVDLRYHALSLAKSR